MRVTTEEKEGLKMTPANYNAPTVHCTLIVCQDVSGAAVSLA